MDQSSSTHASWFTWRVGDDTVRATDLPVGANVVSAAHGRIVVQVGDSQHAATDATRSVLTRFGVGSDWSTSPLLDASGRQVAYVAGRTKGRPNTMKNPNRVLVARLPAAGSDVRRQPRPIPGSARTFEVLTWTDAEHVVLLQRDGDDYDRERLVVADVVTGQTRLVTTGDLYGTFRSGQVATDLLDHPPIAAPGPPSPWDPRVTWGLVGIVLLSGAVGLIVWRRRAPA